jgi:hypothetical protein
MDIVKKNPEVYGLQMVSKNCHRIVKVVKEYADEQQAIFDLTKLLVGEITEQELNGASDSVCISEIELLNALELALRALKYEANCNGDLYHESVPKIEMILKKYGRG